MEIKEITKRNYQAQVRRGLITPKTDTIKFLRKLFEEGEELAQSFYKKREREIPDFDKVELADVALVCFAIAEHYKIDLIKEMENKMLFNETRKD